MRGSVASSAVAVLALAGVAIAPAVAAAHISATTAAGPAYADATQEVFFHVGHGCEGSDTSSITVEVPPSVVTVRAVDSTFAKAVLTKDTAGKIVSVTWTRTDPDPTAKDEKFYKLSLRIKVPKEPFSVVYFPTHQTCQTSAGPVTTDWVGATENESHDAGAAPEPAPALLVLPARHAGWNKYIIPAALDAAALKKMFADAQIVWKGTTAAYSVNPVTVEQLTQTGGITLLTALAAGDEVWVKY